MKTLRRASYLPMSVISKREISHGIITLCCSSSQPAEQKIFSPLFSKNPDAYFVFKTKHPCIPVLNKLDLSIPSVFSLSLFLCFSIFLIFSSFLKPLEFPYTHKISKFFFSYSDLNKLSESKNALFWLCAFFLEKGSSGGGGGGGG